jgi:hypothetical protein
MVKSSLEIGSAGAKRLKKKKDGILLGYSKGGRLHF